MSDELVRKFQKELNAGAVSLVLLTLLDDNDSPMYGYEIAKHLQMAAQQELPMNQAALYPVLRSLEKQGLLASQVVPSDSGPPRKYYQLTALGRRTVPLWRATWASTKAFVDTILESENATRPPRSGSKLSKDTGDTAQTPLRRPRRGSTE